MLLLVLVLVLALGDRSIRRSDMANNIPEQYSDSPALRAAEAICNKFKDLEERVQFLERELLTLHVKLGEND